MTGIMTKLILRECMEKAQANYESSLAKPKIDINEKIKLSKEHLKELRSNAYSGSKEEDVIDHIAKVLEILDSIKIPNVDTNRLHMHVFHISLTDAARKCDEEWEESDYENPPNTDIDSFFKPYLDAQEKGDICLIEKEHQPKKNSSDVSVQNSASYFDEKKNDLINVKVCKAEKFEVIKCSLGANEEYIAISTREKNT
nr:hypothetical protein [Tanacetum cinerariifolium]